ncbi:hypothetical protein [Streptomyces lunaelactis]|uniref:hypothetical protein n=1 Tax=Streptomyces lunaelactis TaxID=1535768 RepID=UPI0015855104|nr:hypothetical protein [Streptomyces lunaelactis]NUK04512.1 hypothetical protein [Streptomyces lunaelactis]NUK18939.1 hypothetical protein [Streptomyces lunaelactis]NUK26368.1 hypothetical protein [Streptomyces lunaelactis]
MGVFALAFLAFALVDPRRAWWHFQARRFENPEAHEPSPASFKWLRVAMVGVAAFLAWQFVGMLRLAGVFDSGTDHGEILERVESVAADLETAKDGRYKLSGLEREGSWGSFIKARLRGPGDDPIATLASKSGDVERYDVDGICLTVTATPMPGQSEQAHAMDNLMYGLKTDAGDGGCTLKASTDPAIATAVRTNRVRSNSGR